MNNLNNHRQPEPALGFSVADIYFILFRHKKAIALMTFLGIVSTLVSVMYLISSFASDLNGGSCRKK